MNEIEQYISKFPEEVQQLLQKIRTIIKETAPMATEEIVYGMPGQVTKPMANLWFTLLDIKTTSVFMQPHRDTKHFKKSFQNTNKERVPYSFL